MHVWLCNGSANACEASSEEQSGWSFNCSIFFFFFFISANLPKEQNTNGGLVDVLLVVETP